MCGITEFETQDVNFLVRSVKSKIVSSYVTHGLNTEGGAALSRVANQLLPLVNYALIILWIE